MCEKQARKLSNDKHCYTSVIMLNVLLGWANQIVRSCFQIRVRHLTSKWVMAILTMVSAVSGRTS